MCPIKMTEQKNTIKDDRVIDCPKLRDRILLLRCHLLQASVALRGDGDEMLEEISCTLA